MLSSNKQEIWLEPGLLDRLMDNCLAQSPNEACGLLFGERSGECLTVTRFQCIRNAAETPKVRFSFDPEEWIPLLCQTIHPASEQIIGIFHSHPGGPAVPSLEDLELQWEFPVYMILSLLPGIITPVRCFNPRPGQSWEEQTVKIRNGLGESITPLNW